MGCAGQNQIALSPAFMKPIAPAAAPTAETEVCLACLEAGSATYAHNARFLTFLDSLSLEVRDRDISFRLVHSDVMAVFRLRQRFVLPLILCIAVQGRRTSRSQKNTIDLQVWRWGNVRVSLPCTGESPIHSVLEVRSLED